jgi:hypothetical protein
MGRQLVPYCKSHILLVVILLGVKGVWVVILAICILCIQVICVKALECYDSYGLALIQGVQVGKSQHSGVLKSLS